MTEYKWTDYICEGCRIYKMVKKRESDGKMLCKRCSKNQSLAMFGKYKLCPACSERSFPNGKQGDENES